MEKELKKYLDGQFERLATKDDLEETHRLVAKGFSAIEKKMASKADLELLEQRLGVKIDGVRNSLDAEILRRTDEYAVILKRLAILERFHGIAPKKRKLITA